MVIPRTGIMGPHWVSLRMCRLGKKKKSTPWKLSIMIYLADKTEDLSPEDKPSGHSERLLQGGKTGASVYGRFCNKDQVVETSKGYC